MNSTTARSEHRIIPISAKRQLKILLVEDDTALCEILKSIFEDRGYACVACTDAADFGQVFRSFQPDLILVDYLLPTSNGGELCLGIKKNEAAANIPVVMMSSLPAYMLPLNFYNCDAFIQKPFSINQLLKPVSSLLSNCGKMTSDHKNTRSSRLSN